MGDDTAADIARVIDCRRTAGIYALTFLVNILEQVDEPAPRCQSTGSSHRTSLAPARWWMQQRQCAHERAPVVPAPRGHARPQAQAQ